MQLSIGPPQSIEHRGLAYCYTAYIYIYAVLLHPMLDLGQCIYIEGRWTPQPF